jgi:putative acetyltransferase
MQGNCRSGMLPKNISSNDPGMIKRMNHDTPQRIGAAINMSVDRVDAMELEVLLRVWEASVRATHDFVSEDDIQFFKPLVRDALPVLELCCVRHENTAVGFVGVAHGKVEMLFVYPDWMGQGVGRALLEHAVQNMDATQLDVNEQNPKALGFYQRMGFVVVGRSELDGTGKPYPILHMALRDDLEK